jgi:uncharacterized protein with HEPN domain
MKRKTPKLLDDIRDAAAFIEDVSRGRSLEDYCSDRLLRQAVERNFEIIGEAINRLVRIDPDVADRIEHARIIVGFRNLLAHGYDLIDDERVWKTIVRDVPPLRCQVEKILGTGGAENHGP